MTAGADADLLSLSLPDDGIAWLTLHPAEAGGVSEAFLAQLDAHLDAVERAAQAGGLAALVVHGAWPERWMPSEAAAKSAAVATAAAGAARALRAQQVLRRLELLPVPTVAAIAGACPGSGAELALACAYRVASAAAGTRIGFPATRRGLIPAWGGTVRLPRLVGLRAALELVLGGESVDAAAARRLGLVDAVLPAAGFTEAAAGFARARLQRGRQRVGPRRGVRARLLEDTAPGRRVVLAQAARRWSAAPHANPAVSRALEVMAAGLALPLEKAFELEAQAAGALLVSPEARALAHVARLAPQHDEAAARVEQVGVLGATPAGAEAAHLLARHGLAVRLRDPQPERLTHTRRYLAELAAAGAPRKPAAGTRVSASTGWGGFGTLELVLAPGERPAEEYARLLAEAEEHVREDCVLAVGSDVVTVGALQPALAAPERLLGLHLAPLPGAALVEVVAGEHTGDAALALALALVRRLGGTALPVADRPGLLLRRLLLAYVNEALHLLDDGASSAQVDGALREYGMTRVPLRLLHDVGLERYTALAARLAGALGERLRPPEALARLRRAGPHGVYHHARGGAAHPAATPWKRRAQPAPFARDEIQERVLLALLNEAVHALDDGVVRDAGLVDLASLAGFGFPAAQGGLLWWADRRGAAALVRSLQELAERHGARFAPAAGLLHRAKIHGAADAPALLAGHGPGAVLS